MKLSNSQDKSSQNKKRQSLFKTSELGKTINRINSLPINIQDHGDHWKRITDLAEQSNPSITMHQPTLRRSSEISETSGKYDSQSVSQQSRKTRPSYSSEKTVKESEELTIEVEEESKVFDRYTEFGGIKSQETVKVEDEEGDKNLLFKTQFNKRQDQTELILHTNRSIRKQISCIKDHPKPQPFPDRQLYIYVIADPTDMRIELTNLRMYVWPYLQRICNERGFTLNIIDDNMDTDIEPRNQLMTPIMNTSCDSIDDYELKEHLSRRMKQKNFLNCLSNMSPVSDAIPNRRNTLKFSNVTPIQMTQIEDSIRQKSEIIRTLNPDILDKWYCPTSDSHPDISYLQPVSQVLPGITCFDDQNIRQAELKSWLNDSHRIRCLLMRFSDQSQIISSSATSYRLSDMEIPTPNTERSQSNTDSIPNSNRQTDMTDRSSYVKEKYNFQSEVERQIELVLQNNELNSDCFVHIRYHQDNKIPSKKSTNINDPSITSWRSRSLSLASWSTTRTNVNTMNSSSSSSIKNEFLSSAFDESLARAKLLVNWARLKVPANNQSHYELEKSALITLNDQIHCTQSYLDPINYQEHAIYLDDLCRNIRNKFSQSLIEEMNRRYTNEMENRINKQVNYLYHWCLEYEISAHLEMMERLSSMYIAREELLMELYNSIIKHTINCQENNGTNRNYFKFIQIKGESGSGKSVLLASLAKRLLAESMKVNTSIVNPRVIYRMIGSSTMSLNLLNLLSYLCIELSTRMNNSSIPDTYDGLRTALHTAIVEATYEQSSQQPLIIILDGIENIEGIYKLSIWLWKDNTLKHLIGPINLIDKPQHIKDPQFLNDPKQKSLRSISLPNTMKSNTELLISSYIYDNKLYIITGYKGDSKAIMFHINILFNHYHLDDKQSIQQTYLLCPNQGTRIIGIYSQLTQSIIIIPNRSPSMITLNDKIIDCIDLFDKQSGNFIKRIESINDNTFSFMEPYLNNFNVLTTWISLPKLFMYYDILITLEKLEYSIIVEECKEVYQRMGIYEIDYNPTNEFHLNHIRHLTDVFIIPNHLTEYKIIYSSDPDTTSYLLGLNETRSHFVAYNLLNGQVIWRLKPDFSIYPEYKENSLLNIKYDPSIQQKSNSYLKNSTIEKFLISGNQSILIVSYSMECVCVFLMSKLKHVGYLDENYAMMNRHPLQSIQQHQEEPQPERPRRFDPPNLSISTISYDGYWLVHTEYSHEEQCTCLTIWSLIHFHNNQLIKEEYNLPWIRKRLLNQSNLIQLTISNYNCIIIGARLNYGLICWCPCKQMNSIYLQGSQYLKFTLNYPPLLNISTYGNKIISISGYIKRTQITIWQLDINDLTICLISNICYIDNIIELQLTNEKLLLCITTRLRIENK
ncbi:hypothetical protein Smp_159200 [Schistosoma mansoni]|uniref:hypothetical protein n=1 Tax=Schistosoma mansoni TaxID=6183 RepID=UPI00022DBFB4|nr:hypothetical protein Smp_159200 [Schistosoma mansoni]|eukprot:XP_018652757.1 hypothetical protein Smp_159200 [Schistosoma mansoni]